jgi:hypothetical protein
VFWHGSSGYECQRIASASESSRSAGTGNFNLQVTTRVTFRNLREDQEQNLNIRRGGVTIGAVNEAIVYNRTEQ